MKLSAVAKLLYYSGIDTPRHDAVMLFLKFTDYDKNELYLGDPDSNDERLRDAVDRRSRREPLQYIIGEVDFFREKYEVSPDCLIPRQDTEILVEVAVKNIPDGESFLDLCTGSGCIAISTLKNTKNTYAFAVDISDGALNIAKRNAELNGVSDRLCLKRHDALCEAVEGEFFAILSNPPYVTEEEYAALAPELAFEPKIALVAEDDGLVFYKRITALYKDRIKSGGFILFEIGHTQADALREIAKSEGLTFELFKDYSGNDRVVMLKKP